MGWPAQAQPIEVRGFGVTGPGPAGRPSLANPHIFVVNLLHAGNAFKDRQIVKPLLKMGSLRPGDIQSYLFDQMWWYLLVTGGPIEVRALASGK